MVSVSYAPVFNHSLETVNVYEGDDNGGVLACDAHSQPSSAWSWSYRASSSNAWQEIEGASANVLTISDPQQSNEGWYRCTAANVMGSTSEAAYLTVLTVNIVRVKYSVSFDITAYGTSSMVIDSLHLETVLLNNTLPSILNASSVEIAEMSAINKGTFFTVSFDLISPSLPYTLNDCLESVAIVVDALLTELEQVKQSLGTVLNSDNGLTVNLTGAELVSLPDSLLVGARVFVCPVGHGLDSSLLFCGKC